jgi:ferredoxin-type protein NapF
MSADKSIHTANGFLPTRKETPGPETPPENRARLRIRLAVRYTALAAAVIVAWVFVSFDGAAMAMVALSPFVAVGSALATRSVGWATVVALPVLAMAFVRRRWFCRWMCPTGLLCEGVGSLFPCRGKTVSQAEESSPRHGKRLPTPLRLGHWIALITFAGAIVGYPILVWLDPLALLASFLGAGWNDPLAKTALVSGAGLSAVLALSLFSPGLWCMRICPLGATQELLAALSRLAACHCLPAAEEVSASDKPVAAAGKCHTGWPLARRALLASGVGAVWAWAVRRSFAAPSQVIRPPGAIDEARFRGVCVRCGNCLRACPTKILHADLGDNGLSGLMSPLVRLDPGYCREDCCRCGDVCPSGAIARLAQSEKKTTRMGLAKVEADLCLLTDNRECSICRNCCPYEAITTVWSEEEYTMVLKIDPDRCPGCGACQVACPTSPSKAIVVHA